MVTDTIIKKACILGNTFDYIYHVIGYRQILSSLYVIVVPNRMLYFQYFDNFVFFPFGIKTKTSRLFESFEGLDLFNSSPLEKKVW